MVVTNLMVGGGRSASSQHWNFRAIVSIAREPIGTIALPSLKCAAIARFPPFCYAAARHGRRFSHLLNGVTLDES